MKMMREVICFVLLTLVDAKAYQELQKPTVKATYPTAIYSCANETGVTFEQFEAAKRQRDINLISACFFRCFLVDSGLINQGTSRETLNVSATLILAKIYIPTITFMNLLPIAAEVIDCASEFGKELQSDGKHDCPKTKILVNCLVEKKTLINAIRLATES